MTLNELIDKEIEKIDKEIMEYQQRWPELYTANQDEYLRAVKAFLRSFGTKIAKESIEAVKLEGDADSGNPWAEGYNVAIQDQSEAANQFLSGIK